MFWLKWELWISLFFLLHGRSKDKQQTLLVSRWRSPTNVVLRGPEGGSCSRILASFSRQSWILNLCHFNPEHRFFFPNTAPGAKTLAKPACRVTVKSRVPSRYFAFSRIPRCISDPERILFLTLVLVSLRQLDNTLLKSEVSVRFVARKTCVFRAIMTFYKRYPWLFDSFLHLRCYKER